MTSTTITEPLATNYLNLDKLLTGKVTTNPYPHMIIENFISPEKIMAICEDFPNINQPGSFSLSDIPCEGEFANLISALKSPDFRNGIAKQFSIDLANRPITITARGYSRDERDGRVHTDSKSKLITVLIYFNPIWAVAGGRLRLLNSNNIDDYYAEVPPTAGTCLIFKVTDNCWHGYTPYTGIRHAIQLNFVANEQSANYQLLHHRLSAKLKALKNFIKR